jgi:hypothetical protein
MIVDHRFQTPRVVPFHGEGAALPESAVVLRVASSDVERIVRALDEVSLGMAPAPGGARGAKAYRRLAAEIRGQAHGSSRPPA